MVLHGDAKPGDLGPIYKHQHVHHETLSHLLKVVNGETENKKKISDQKRKESKEVLPARAGMNF